MQTVKAQKTRHFKVQKKDISTHCMSDFKVHCPAMPLIRRNKFRPYSKTLFNSHIVNIVNIMSGYNVCYCA